MNILLVWKKEVLNTIQDKRTLTMMVIVPLILMPVMIGLPFMMHNQFEQVEESEARVHVIGLEQAPELAALLEQDGRIALVGVDDPEQSLVDGQIEALLTLPPDFSEQVAAGRTVSVDIAFEQSHAFQQHPLPPLGPAQQVVRRSC